MSLKLTRNCPGLETTTDLNGQYPETGLETLPPNFISGGHLTLDVLDVYSINVRSYS